MKYKFIKTEAGASQLTVIIKNCFRCQILFDMLTKLYIWKFGLSVNFIYFRLYSHKTLHKTPRIEYIFVCKKTAILFFFSDLDLSDIKYKDWINCSMILWTYREAFLYEIIYFWRKNNSRNEVREYHIL